MKLTDTQRRQILERDYPRIALTPEEAKEVVLGQRIVLKEDQVWIELVAPRRDKKGGWHLEYIVRDDRPRLMRRNPHGMDVRDIRSRMDEYGVPRRVNEQDAAAAAETSHYTQSLEQAVAHESEEVVPVDYQQELTKRARRNQDDFNREHRMDEIAKRDAQRLNHEIRELAKRAVKSGKDPAVVLAPIAKLVEQQHANIKGS